MVTGYLGGEINPVDGYLIVRQSEAHAWTEVWLPAKVGCGWIPTAAVSPLRIERGLAAAVPETDQASLRARNRLEWLRKARFAWDAVANSWNQWVLGYNPDRQVRFLSQHRAGRGHLAKHGDRAHCHQRPHPAGAGVAAAHAALGTAHGSRAARLCPILPGDGPTRRTTQTQRRTTRLRGQVVAADSATEGDGSAHCRAVRGAALRR